MISYSSWRKIELGYFVGYCTKIYKKECVNNKLNIVLKYHPNGYGWTPEFYNELMYDVYKRYNPEYYLYSDDADYVMQYIDKFINKYINLLVFI